MAKSQVRNRAEDGSPNPVDVHVGALIKMRRIALGMTQANLGEHLGITFQQVQKYERGQNRLGASRLFDMSRALSVPVEFFFTGLDGQVGSLGQQTPEDVDLSKGVLAITKYFRVLSRPLQIKLREIARIMADPETLPAE